MRRLAANVAVVLVVSLAGLSPASAATLGSSAIAQLNAQRAANGIPAGLVEDPMLSDDCAAHDRYMALNHALTHSEIAGNPGYSPAGAYAGQNAVLAQGAGWGSGNPYEFAPLHLDQLLAPRLAVLGSADAAGYSCTTTFPGWTRPDPAVPGLTVYTYPGPGATIYPSEVARELPWTPGQLVGIAQNARTGPNITVLVDARGQSPKANPAILTSATTLTGPTGPVAVKTVDGMTALPPSHGGGTLAGYISPGGFIIPLAPLAPGATYRAHVVVVFGGEQTTRDWSFTTRGKNPHSTLRIVRGSSLLFHSVSAQPILVRFTRAGGAHAPGVRLRPSHRTLLHLSPGSWQACGTQAAGGGFDSYSTCLGLTVTGRPALRLSAPRISSSGLRLRLRFSSVLRRRLARLTLTPLSVRCRAHRCHTVAGHPSVRVVVLRSAVLTVPVPAPHQGIQVALSTSAFQLRDAPWTAASASFRYLRP